jgi:hypothetical protein
MSSREYLNRPLHEADGPLVWIDCEMTGRPLKYSSIPPHGPILHCILDGWGLPFIVRLEWTCRTRHSRVVCILDGKLV